MLSSLLLLLFGAGVYWSASAAAVAPGPDWTITGSTGEHHMLMVDVQARPAARLRDIGEDVVGQFRNQFDEILIYVRSGKSTLRRIRWTPQHGFEEMVISD